MKEEEIVNNIKEFIRSESPFNYYVGITNYPKVQLIAHNALDVKAVSIQADDKDSARGVEKYFINTFGTDGKITLNNENSTFVYCYKKGNETNENA